MLRMRLFFLFFYGNFEWLKFETNSNRVEKMFEFEIDGSFDTDETKHKCLHEKWTCVCVSLQIVGSYRSKYSNDFDEILTEIGGNQTLKPENTFTVCYWHWPVDCELRRTLGNQIVIETWCSKTNYKFLDWQEWTQMKPQKKIIQFQVYRLLWLLTMASSLTLLITTQCAHWIEIYSFTFVWISCENAG